MAARIDEVMGSDRVPVSVITRCAVALATVPVVLRHRPDTVVLWLDAHADLNTPEDTVSGYLGGMALSGPLGWWDSRLGAGLPEAQAILVGTRDLDPAEQAHVDDGRTRIVAPGADIGDRLASVIGSRPVYFHLDCDVLQPGIVGTDYHVSGGLSLTELRECALVASRTEVIGVEVAEFESEGTARASDLVEALSALLE